MKLDWDELEKNILHENVKLQTNSKRVLDLSLPLDKAPFSEGYIVSASYYVNAGVGNENSSQYK